MKYVITTLLLCIASILGISANNIIVTDKNAGIHRFNAAYDKERVIEHIRPKDVTVNLDIVSVEVNPYNLTNIELTLQAENGDNLVLDLTQPSTMWLSAGTYVVSGTDSYIIDPDPRWTSAVIGGEKKDIESGSLDVKLDGEVYTFTADFLVGDDINVKGSYIGKLPKFGPVANFNLTGVNYVEVNDPEPNGFYYRFNDENWKIEMRIDLFSKGVIPKTGTYTFSESTDNGCAGSYVILYAPYNDFSKFKEGTVTIKDNGYTIVNINGILENGLSLTASFDGTLPLRPSKPGNDFEYEGLFYTVIDPKAKTCKTREGQPGDDNSSATSGNECQGAVSIPEKVSDGADEYTVTEIGQYSFSGSVGLTAMEIPATVTSIGQYAFSECINLTSVNVPESITSIGSSAFRACARLTSIALPGRLTSLPDMSFALCSSLSSIDLPESLTEIGDMAFAACSSLTSIEIPNSVSKIGIQAFGNCTALKSIHLPDALTSVSDALLIGCSALNSIEIPENVTSIGRSSFERCASINDIHIPESVTSIAQRAFRDCVGLTSVNIPQSLTSIEAQVFYGCTGLTSIDIPESVALIGEGAFMECSELTSVTIPGSVTSIGGRAFYGCPNITSVTYSASTPVSANEDIFNEPVYQDATLNMPNANLADIQSTIPWSLFINVIAKNPSLAAGDDFEYEGIWYTVIDPDAKTCKTKDSLGDFGSDSFVVGNNVSGEIIIPPIVSDGKSEYIVVEIGDAGFRGTEIGSITIPETVIEIGNNAFGDCISLRFVNLPASMPVTQHSVFDGCDNIHIVNYAAESPVECSSDLFGYGDVYNNANLIMRNATLASIHEVEPWCKFRNVVAKDGEIPYPFQYDGIWYAVIDAVCKKVSTLEEYAFYPDNYYEGELVIPSVVHYENEEYTVVEIGSFSFQSLSGLTSVVMPATVIKLGQGAFHGCGNLVSVELSDSLIEVGEGVFNKCVSLKKISLPEGLEYVGDYMFLRCTGMESIDIPNSVISIGWGAFYGCSSLTEIVIPNSVISIGWGAFYGCSSLTEIVIPNSVTTIGEQAFRDCGNVVTISIPGTVSEFGNYAFNTLYSPTLMTVNYDAVVPKEAEDNIFYGSAYNQATLNMPNARLADILATTPWNKFRHIIASDGSIGFVQAGDDFEYEGIWYTVLDVEARTCMTKGQVYDQETGNYVAGNNCSGELVIPTKAYYGQTEYTVVGIGVRSFKGNELTSVTIPETVTVIPTSAFEECSSLTSAQLPESITLIEGTAFQSCTSLSSINWPQSLKTIEGGAFNFCNLTSVEFPEGLEQIGQWAFQGNPLVSVSIPSTLSYVENSPFNYCNAISEVNYYAELPITLDETLFTNAVYQNAILNAPNAIVADIQATMPWNKFRRIVCSDGTSGFVSAGDDFQYEGIWYTIIDSDAKTCRTKAGDGGAYGWQMTPGNRVEGDIVIPSTVILYGDEYRVIEIGDYGFSSQGNLTSVTFPDSLVNIGQFAFYQCNGLTSLTLPNSVEYIDSHAFWECENLADVKFSESLKFIGAGAFRAGKFRTLDFPESLSEIREDAFGYCYELETVKFPSAMENIGGSAFASCTALTSVVLPEEMESVSSYIFDGCTGITEITLPKSPSVIDTGAFRGCSALTSIELPSSITKFGYWVFEGCTGLSEITYLAEVPVSSGVDMFDGTVYESAILNMPNAVITDVKAIQPWSLFIHIIAKDGNSGFVSAGDDFEYEGVWYTIIDPESKAVRTKENGNVNCDEEIVIPAEVSDGQESYTVVEIGQDSFRGAEDILSVSLPATIEVVGRNAFANCPRLAAFVWTRQEQLADRVVEEINNPNLLLYVEDAKYAPEGMTANVVADGVCDRLVLTQGYPFKPLYDFTANYSSLTKEFTQTTPIDGCAGWETIVLPFDATSVRVNDARGALTPFPLVTDIETQYPYWIYQAESEGEWSLASSIQAGIPYLVAMPNNPEYEVRYNIDGPVTFSNPNPTRILAETASPYAVTWASGRQFRSLWLPLDGEQATDALGLNANVSGLTDEDGETLAPGSAFVVGITPKLLEAYVTRNGSGRVFRISGAQSGVLAIPDGQGLKMTQDGGLLFLRSDTDRIIQVYSISGAVIRKISLKAGVSAVIDDLPQGVCIIAGRKVMIR